MNKTIGYSNGRLAEFAGKGLTTKYPDHFNEKIREFGDQVAKDLDGDVALPETLLSQEAIRLLDEAEVIYQEFGQ